MTAVTAIPITIAVTTSAEGIGSTTRDVASERSSERSMIGAVQNIAMGEQAPEPDKDQQKTCYENGA